MTDRPSNQPWVDPDDTAGELDVDLNAKLRGYDPMVATPDGQRTEEPQVETRLCPACGGVREFVNGRCRNCGHTLGRGADLAPEFEPAASGSGMSKAVIIVLVFILLVALYLFVWPYVRPEGGTGGATPAPGGDTPAARTPPSVTGKGDGPRLEAVAIDDAFRTELEAALELGSAAWDAQSVDSYVYRYRVNEVTSPGVSQAVTVIGFLGGKQAELAAQPPDDKPFRDALQPWEAGITKHAGVTVLVLLESTDGETLPDPADRYIRYGYYYGRENLRKIQPVNDRVEAYKDGEGQYPMSLYAAGVERSKTRGAMGFVAQGFGYLPIFRTDGAGQILMGSGGTLERITPAEVTDCYIFYFLPTADAGLDLWSEAEEEYFLDKLAPLPYEGHGQLRNMKLQPDGKPDGVACVLKNGELQR